MSWIVTYANLACDLKSWLDPRDAENVVQSGLSRVMQRSCSIFEASQNALD